MVSATWAAKYSIRSNLIAEQNKTTYLVQDVPLYNPITILDEVRIAERKHDNEVLVAVMRRVYWPCYITVHK